MGGSPPTGDHPCYTLLLPGLKYPNVPPRPGWPRPEKHGYWYGRKNGGCCPNSGLQKKITALGHFRPNSSGPCFWPQAKRHPSPKSRGDGPTPSVIYHHPSQPKLVTVAEALVNTTFIKEVFSFALAYRYPAPPGPRIQGPVVP